MYKNVKIKNNILISVCEKFINLCKILMVTGNVHYIIITYSFGLYDREFKVLFFIIFIIATLLQLSFHDLPCFYPSSPTSAIRLVFCIE